MSDLKDKKKESIYSTYVLVFVGLFHFVMGVFAIYLSFKCNKGLNFSSLFLAYIFSPFYVIYQLAVNFKKCFPK